MRLVALLVKKFSAFGPGSFLTVHKSPPLDPVLSLINTVRTPISYILKTLLMPSTPRSPSLPLLFRFSALVKSLFIFQ